MGVILEKYLIIYCHPSSVSFTHEILDQVVSNLQKNDLPFDVIDLYREKFNPSYTEEELRTGRNNDPKLEEYFYLLEHSDRLIFITPVWRNEIPELLKGFLDKIIRKEKLFEIKKAYVLTTTRTPTLYYRCFCGDRVKKLFIRQTLNYLGIKKYKWINLGNFGHTTKKVRDKFLKLITDFDFQE